MELELYGKDYISEATRMQELVEENIRLRVQLQELRQPSEVDVGSNTDSGQGGEVDDSPGSTVCVHVYIMCYQECMICTCMYTLLIVVFGDRNCNVDLPPPLPPSHLSFLLLFFCLFPFSSVLRVYVL